MDLDKIQLAQFVKMDDPECVIDEVKTITLMLFPDFDFEPVNVAFRDTLRLFAGQYPGYHGCNTEYHDLKHTTDALLAMARLIHGAILQGRALSRHDVTMGLVATLLHDSGYMQKMGDEDGTGAKYTTTHVLRSIDFLEMYLTKNGFPPEDFPDCAAMLRCTGLTVKINEVLFSSAQIEMLGKMLGTADLIGQMADRTYLEKLLLLFYEFREGNVDGYTNEFDLLRKTIGFFDFTRNRLVNELGSVGSYMRFHFNARWNLDIDMYAVTMERNQTYLDFILKNHPDDYRSHLRRGDYVERLRSRGM